MPLKPQKPISDRSKKRETIQVEPLETRAQMLWRYLRSERAHTIFSVLLLALAFLLFVSFVSFFFTGAQDFSLMQMSRAERIANRLEVGNILGLAGAWVSRALIDGTFGWMSFTFVVLLSLLGLRGLHVIRIPLWKTIFVSLFLLVWGSVLLGFLQYLTGFATFYRWGGAHGEWLTHWSVSYIQSLGTAVVLLVTIVIFGIVVDRHFVDHCLSVWNRITSLFHRPAAPEVSEAPETIEILETADTPEPSAEEKPVEVDLTIEGLTPESPADTHEGEVTFTIETVADTDTDADNSRSTLVAPNTQELPSDNDNDNENDNENDNTIDSFSPEVGDEVELSEDDPEYILKTQGPYDPRQELSTYQFPSLSLLKVYDNETQPVVNQEEQQANANRIVTTLRNYGVEIDSIKATVGPTVTLYEVVPRAGQRISKIQSLENDIMLALSAVGIRIIAPMPGKGTVGIEVPNEKPQVVSMHSVIASKRFQEEQKMRLPVALGRTITNEVFMFDLAKTPHLLVAGATGQGKSVGLNAIITSLLYKKHPAELKFVLVDPKMVEFSIYKPLLKHYMAAMPDQDEEDIIITDCQKVINTLNSLVIEMEDRYSLLSAANCRNLEDYNDKFIRRRLNPVKPVENRVTKKILHHHFMPYLVIVIDEYGDFIMQAGKEVEHPIQRLAQKARAVGMHLILATQRPDVKIVTGTIKANIPTRIAFRTQSVIDSRTVLDQTGANQLIGKGDLLYSGGGNLTRIQCAFVDTPEVEQIVEHVHGQQHYFEPYQLPEYVPEGAEEAVQPGSVDMRRLDPMFADVARYVVSKQEGSTSRLQRAFEIGYNRAGKLSDQLEAAGIVGPNKGSKGRDVLIQDLESLERILDSLNQQ